MPENTSENPRHQQLADTIQRIQNRFERDLSQHDVIETSELLIATMADLLKEELVVAKSGSEEELNNFVDKLILLSRISLREEDESFPKPDLHSAIQAAIDAAKRPKGSD